VWVGTTPELCIPIRRLSPTRLFRTIGESALAAREEFLDFEDAEGASAEGRDAASEARVRAHLADFDGHVAVLVSA
jgi:hypothetical protein